MKPHFIDMYELEENSRIKMIGDTVMCKKHDQKRNEPIVVAVMVDDDGAKADRYMKKLKARYPGIREIDRFKGPVAGVITLKISPPLG